MTKQELSTLLRSLHIPVGEGEQFIESKEAMPKIAYWDYIWEDNMASGDDYEELVTYQISFVAKRPRDPALIALKTALNAEGLHPTIYHEYVKGENSPGYFHSYFSLDVTEELTDESA